MQSQLFLYQTYIMIKISRQSLVFWIGWQLLSVDLNSLIETEKTILLSVSVGSNSNFGSVALKSEMCYSVDSKIFIYKIRILKFWLQFLLQITDAAQSHCVFSK